MTEAGKEEAQKLIETGMEYIRAMTAIRKKVGDECLTGRVMAQFTLENIEFILGAAQVLDPEQSQRELLRRLAAVSVVEHHEALNFYYELAAALLPDPPEIPSQEGAEPWHE